MTAVSVPLNPFADQIVTSPRRAEPPVKGLNDQVLRRLLGEFGKVESPPRRCGRIQLVVSPAGGYGKSHLAGRLFRELGRRATRVYVRPFSDPESCWVSLLHSIVQELTGPEQEGTPEAGSFPPTQLDALAHGVFAALLVGLMDAGEFTYNDPNFVRERLMKQAFEKWDLSNPQSAWGAWAAETLDSFEKSDSRSSRLTNLFEELTQHSLSNTTRPQAWIRVLRSYCQDRADAPLRELALEWIRARTPRVAEGTEPLGLMISDGEDQTVGTAARNAQARSRVLDLLALAKLFRPFVLCFDQTEVFGRVPGLARAFGSVLSDLVQGEGAHMTVVTANNDVWESQLLPEMERADHDRIAPRIEMLGLTRDQGQELAIQRLKQTRLPEELQKQVVSGDWLEQQFTLGLLSPREFLRRSERRYEEIVPEAPAQPAKPEMMLVELFAREKKQMDARELAEYRGDVLRWALLDVPTRVASGIVAKPCRTESASFVAEWKAKDDKQWLIVLEEGSHALSWRSIATRAIARKGEDENVSTLAFRIAGQPQIPQDGWAIVGPEIEQAVKSAALRLVNMSSETLARVYACWELYTQACQGDIPHEPDAVVRFTAQRLQAWYSSLRGATKADEDSTESMDGSAASLPASGSADSTSANGAAKPTTATSVVPLFVPAPIAPKPSAPVVPKPSLATSVVPKAPQPPAPVASEVAAAEPQNSSGGETGKSLTVDISQVMRQIISVRRFASYAEISEELRAKAGRDVPLHEASSAAESTGDIRVYAQGANAGFLWQGW